MKVSVQYAEAHFTDLLEAASNGIEVEIALPEKPSLKLVTTAIAPEPKQEGRRILGLGPGQMPSLSLEELKDIDWGRWPRKPDDPPTAQARQARSKLIGSGIGEFWLSPDAFSPEADAEIQQMFDDEIERSTLNFMK